ncbi:type I restriction modification DNA specificity domain protein [Clostridium argentinense CDC 2741]|uniref:Type I restriction modification DNA specificity domain protein n=2 Tax=Clostridium argentinense TaxID=29341 RepID=A0A0C1UIE9_9CLOT|nr:restriction endonuclease subunit S [Clostridium argentinense]ARC85479.1 hypothetical protein RSJ17_13695 [Clostridium argentinense]KIE47110.1 type I restriction modification DNA specificity domain protein [Clostridium argentinense CDC 2741]NFP50310.1 hypothetical protein [Clostridium argentinense]NFP71951.1 hypothetical protein [Clostridium argentinense]NFP76168.1 hypothetical protein [Clostridium argentinense]
MDIKKIKCSEIIDVRDGTHDSPKYQLKGYPLVTSKNIKGNKIDFNNVNFISEEDYNKINMRSSVHNGDILMPMIGTIGNPVLVDTNEKFAIKNVALFKLSNNNKVDSKYFYYLLTSDIVKNQLENRKRGGTQNFVSLSNIRSLEIPLVAIEKQIFISNILDKAQSLIDKRKAQIEALDELVKSQFIEMFGDNWKEVNLIDYVWLQEGPGVRSIDFTEEGTVLLTGSNINDNEISFGYKSDRYISNELANGKYNHFICDKDDVLVVSSAIAPDKFDKKVVVVKEDKKYCLNTGIIRFKPNSKYLIINYFREFLKTDFFKYQVMKEMRGIAQMHFGPSHLKNMKILLPPIELQNQFSDFVKQVDKLKFEMEKSLKELEDNFNSLMQRAFKGELFN